MCLFFDPYASNDQGRYASRHTYVSFQKYKWAHFPGRKSFSFFLRAPYILRTTYFSGGDGGQEMSRTRALLVGEGRNGMSQHNTWCSGTSYGGINPYTLTAKLGPAQIDGSGPSER